ncbi:MAG: hypothetical protein ABI383_04990 [Acidobacteriaceae bacterium]
MKIDLRLTTEKVVVHKADAVVKGLYDTSLFHDLAMADTVRQRYGAIPDRIQLRLHGSGLPLDISLVDAKAVFFVKDFDGQKQRKDLNFHQRASSIDGVWVQLAFHDGETLEGMVFNSIHPLIDPGFFLIPTDPGSNNRLVYVLKHALADYRVLGLRPL